MKRSLILASVVFALAPLLAGCEKKEAAAPAPPPAREILPTPAEPLPQTPATVPATEPTTQAAIALPATNTSCPVSGDEVDPTDPKLPRVAYLGKTYVLCCKDCVPDFEKNPAKFVK